MINAGNGALLLLLVGMLLLIVWHYNKKWKSAVKEKHLMEQSFAEELSASLSNFREETFRSISQEIHDNIGQSLSLVKLNMVTTNPENSVQVAEKLEESKKLLSKTMHDLRNLAHSMNPDFLATIGLPAAIRQQLAQLERPGSHKTFFSATEPWPQRNIQREFVVLRVVQELLHNIVKHARATEAHVYLQYLEQELVLVIKDNGCGFNPEAGPGNGMGLMGIHNRLRKINSAARFESAPGLGTTVFLYISRE